MGKPVLLITVPATHEEKEELQHIAKEYDVVTECDSLDDVEIMYGWTKELGDKLLTLNDSQLAWIQAESAGVNHLPLTTLKEKNILLSSASGIHGNQMSETILGMIFAHTRRIKTSILNQEKSKWDRHLDTTDLVDKKVMIVGTGHIGQRLAEILRAFQVDTFGVNRSGKPVEYFNHVVKQTDMTSLLADMDIVVNLLPATRATYHLFSDELFEAMKDGVIYINAGRGSTVDTDSLIRHCESGKIGFAGLDVFEEEPLPETHPLWKVENVLITSHISGLSDQYYRRLFPVFKHNLQHYIETKQLSQNQIDLTDAQ